MNYLKHKAQSIIPNPPTYNAMSTKTKVFIQKICYKKTASVDMTRNGFINDKKLHPINLLLKPLRERLERIWGKRTVIPASGKRVPIRKHAYKVAALTKPKRTVLVKKDDKINKRRSRDLRKRTRKVQI